MWVAIACVRACVRLPACLPVIVACCSLCLTLPPTHPPNHKASVIALCYCRKYFDRPQKPKKPRELTAQGVLDMLAEKEEETTKALAIDPIFAQLRLQPDVAEWATNARTWKGGIAAACKRELARRNQDGTPLYHTAPHGYLQVKGLFSTGAPAGSEDVNNNGLHPMHMCSLGWEWAKPAAIRTEREGTRGLPTMVTSHVHRRDPSSRVQNTSYWAQMEAAVRGELTDFSSLRAGVLDRVRSWDDQGISVKACLWSVMRDWGRQSGPSCKAAVEGADGHRGQGGTFIPQTFDLSDPTQCGAFLDAVARDAQGRWIVKVGMGGWVPRLDALAPRLPAALVPSQCLGP